MNFEPFMPFERAEPLVPPSAVEAVPPQAHYFDRAGLVWIVACVLFATTAGRLLPTLAEPDGLRNSLAAMGVGAVRVETTGMAKANPATTVASLPSQGANPPQPTRATQAKQEAGPLVPVLHRQF